MSVVEKIQEQSLAAYKAKPALIREHYNKENRERNNYAGRPLLELLQNAEDALTGWDGRERRVRVVLRDGILWALNHGRPFNDRGFQALCDSDDSPKTGRGYIGNKGTGFKSVLNWTEQPAIYSGDIRARFCRSEARDLILGQIDMPSFQKEDANWRRDQVPLLRVPLSGDPDTIVTKYTNEGWDTVLRIPLLDGKALDVQSSIDDFDPECLIFLRHIEELTLCTPTGERTFKVQRKELSSSERCTAWSIQIIDGNNGCSYRLFRRRLDLSSQQPGIPDGDTSLGDFAEVAIAFCLETPTEHKKRSLFNFFPVKGQTSPFPNLLLHGTFLLKPDRNDLLEHDSVYHEKLTKELADLLGESVIPNLINEFGHNSLQYLHPGPEPQRSPSQLHYIWKCLRDTVATKEFLPALGRQSQAPLF